MKLGRNCCQINDFHSHNATAMSFIVECMYVCQKSMLYPELLLKVVMFYILLQNHSCSVWSVYGHQVFYFVSSTRLHESKLIKTSYNDRPSTKLIYFQNITQLIIHNTNILILLFFLTHLNFILSCNHLNPFYSTLFEHNCHFLFLTCIYLFQPKYISTHI